MSKDCQSLFQNLEQKVEEIERLIQLLLLNNLVGDISGIVASIEDNFIPEATEIVNRYGLALDKFQIVNGIRVLCIEIPEQIKITIRDLREINMSLKEVYPDVEPFFIYERINGMHRKKLMQEDVSFCVKAKEMHIINRVIKK